MTRTPVVTVCSSWSFIEEPSQLEFNVRACAPHVPVVGACPCCLPRGCHHCSRRKMTVISTSNNTAGDVLRRGI